MTTEDTTRRRPGGLTGRIVARILTPGADPREKLVRARLGELEGYVSTTLSVFLSAVKFVLGLVSGSISLLADAINNMADIGSSLIIALGFRWSRRPRDREHPFGHGRVEAVATLLLAIFLVAVAWKVGQAGVSRLLDPKPFEVSAWVLGAVVISVAVKTWLAVFARTLARLTGSVTLEADAWNHTYDIACTSLVVVALVCARLGWNAVDGWAGLGVSFFIAYTGLKYGRMAVSTLIGEAPTHEEVHRIRELAMGVPGVFSVHDVILHRYGETCIISLHAEVDANQSAIAVHELAEEVERAVAAEWKAKVTVHADPVDHSHPNYTESSAALAAWRAGHDEILGFHDLRLSGESGALTLSADLVVCQEKPFGGFDELLAEAAADLGRQLPAVQVFDLGIEPEIASDQEHRRRFENPGTA